MISLILKTIRSLVPLKLCNSSQHLNLKKRFFCDEGKPMANHFNSKRVIEHSITPNSSIGRLSFSNKCLINNDVMSAALTL